MNDKDAAIIIFSEGIMNDKDAAIIIFLVFFLWSGYDFIFRNKP